MYESASMLVRCLLWFCWYFSFPLVYTLLPWAACSRDKRLIKASTADITCLCVTGAATVNRRQRDGAAGWYKYKDHFKLIYLYSETNIYPLADITLLCLYHRLHGKGTILHFFNVPWHFFGNRLYLSVTYWIMVKNGKRHMERNT